MSFSREEHLKNHGKKSSDLLQTFSEVHVYQTPQCNSDGDLDQACVTYTADIDSCKEIG